MGSCKKKVTRKEFDKSALETKKLKHFKPKILLVDLDDECHVALRNAGYNVKAGTFGTPAKVDRSGDYYCVPTNTHDLPNLDKQEIIIANLIPNSSSTDMQKPPGMGAYCMWQKASAGVIDPRPIIMSRVEPKIKLLHEHGGLLVLLMGPQMLSNYLWSSVDSYNDPNFDGKKKRYSNWDLCADLNNLRHTSRSGTEIILSNHDLIKPLHKGDLAYSCAFNSHGYAREIFVPLAENKFEEPVAAYYEVDGRPTLLLPQIENLGEIILDLLESSCYQIRPDLFPHLSGANWLHDDMYEIPEIIELGAKKTSLLTAAEAKAKDIDVEIAEVREDQSYWYALLNGTGDDLVQAVITVLGMVGFKQVIDVDAEVKSGKEDSDDNELMEDIRVEDESPWLIIDVKGVNGHPEDGESTQAEKHAMMRMKEWDKTDLHALTLINHQRQLPPLDRDQQAYRKKIIGNAEKTGLGLMTTWDLYKLIRNRIELRWSDEVVKPIFYRSGRIDGIPEHYTLIGEVVEFWEPAFGIVPSIDISVGDRLAYRIAGFFTEFDVESLMVDGNDIDVAQAGSNCGIAFDDAKQTFKKRMEIFKVEKDIKADQTR